MSNTSDFVIENGILKKYCGKEVNVVIPDGVTEIGESAFEGCNKISCNQCSHLLCFFVICIVVT